MRKKLNNFSDEVAFGVCPLGGNAVEGTAPGMSPVRDTRIQGEPLYWDGRVNLWISEQSIEELDDREADLEKARISQDERAWRRRVGYQMTAHPDEEVGDPDFEGSGYGAGPYGSDPWGS